MIELPKLLIYRKKLVRPYVERLLNLVNGATYLFSLLFTIALIFEHGFMISHEELSLIVAIYRLTWLCFIIHFTLQITLRLKESLRNFKRLTWVAGALLYLTLIASFIDEPLNLGLTHTLWQIFNSEALTVILVAILSVLQLSNGFVMMLSQRANPLLILSLSFLVIILIGAGMLMLPRASYEGISFIDALFTATSAACVTGLTTLDVATTFTPMGILFITILIQVGGLGVMTLTSFFALSFMGNASLNNQLLMNDMVSSRSLSSLLSTLLYILGFTAVIELSGAALIFLNIHGQLGMTINEELFFSIFHSISAFCNAGFSTLPGNLGNEMLLSGGHNLFYITITILIILGGIGFPILVNLTETVGLNIKRLWNRYIRGSQHEVRRVQRYNFNTRIVLVMSSLLLLGGFIFIAALEWNNAFAQMPFIDKCVQSLFTAACPRTAGFASVSMASLGTQTILVLIVLMMIGGGTQSTAGGIKVNVFAVVMLNMKAIVTGNDKVACFKREISQDSIRKSNATVIIYVLIIFASLYALTLFEPQATPFQLVFECISALSTVGSSMDLTPTLGSDSKLVIILLMYIGRVGVLTFMGCIIRQHKNTKYRYPSDNIIIN